MSKRMLYGFMVAFAIVAVLGILADVERGMAHPNTVSDAGIRQLLFLGMIGT